MNFYSISSFIRDHYPQYWGIESYPVTECITIHKVSDPWGIFSNFAPTPIVLNNITYKSSEELFQLMKFTDEEVINNIRNNITRAGKTCYNVKKTVKSYEKEFRRPDWASIIVDAMKISLLAKYQQCEAFRQKLEESKGKYIVEDQTSMPKRQPDAWGVKRNGDVFEGPNLLGRLLMELRDTGTLTFQPF